MNSNTIAEDDIITVVAAPARPPGFEVLVDGRKHWAIQSAPNCWTLCPVDLPVTVTVGTAAT
jgi:hypothetical protein